MKKLMMGIATAFMLLTIAPVQMKASIVPSTTVGSSTLPVEDALRTRLSEIKAVDKSNLSSLERKQLRKEKRSVKHQLRDINGGVYLSGAAVVLLVILLIVFL